ncbi:HD domain-containing protein [Allokutzneria oryzae]|uniref:HD domain-containing protein n=1 Tax=Allokutzneria oryzae TaxID=1378989 RepID=A0ABV6A9B8_9PSEU
MSEPTFTLDTAIALATRAHEGQLDKAGQPYIKHPLRVMDSVEGTTARMAAVLHDVIEDTPVTADDLRAAGCPERVVTAVIALSHLPGEPMADYLARAAADPVALVVKRADIADNSGPLRLNQLDEPTRERLRRKYATALRLLDEYEAARGA